LDLPLLISAWHKHCSIPLWDDQNWLPSTVAYAGIQEKVKTGCYDTAQCKLKIGNVLCVITKTVVILEFNWPNKFKLLLASENKANDWCCIRRLMGLLAIKGVRDVRFNNVEQR